MADLDAHWHYLEEAWQAARVAPLSARKARLVAALIDAYVDHSFTADAAAEDILEFRAQMAAQSPALGQIMALCAGNGVSLVTEAVKVPLSDYGRLGVEDFMVSLYNDHSVQRLRLVGGAGEKQDMLAVLGTAMEDLGALNARARARSARQ